MLVAPGTKRSDDGHAIELRLTSSSSPPSPVSNGDNAETGAAATTADNNLSLLDATALLCTWSTSSSNVMCK